jgi:DNA-directed RNA polymerase specialized sigma24 family protein
MSTYADRRAAWEAHNLHRHQASIWAAERARIFREQDIETMREAHEEEERIKVQEQMEDSVYRAHFKERARKMYRAGFTMKEIAEKIGVSYQRARTWVLDLSRGNRGRAYLSPEVEWAKQLRDQGLTYKKMGEIMGCNLETARSRYMRHPDVRR